MNFSINPEKILFTASESAGIVYDIETREHFSLNESLFKILKGIENGMATEKIIRDLCSEYIISEEECREKVNNVIQLLTNIRYIVSYSKADNTAPKAQT